MSERRRDAERKGLEEAREGVPWRKWGPCLVASLIPLFGRLDGKRLLELGKKGAFDRP